MSSVFAGPDLMAGRPRKGMVEGQPANQLSQHAQNQSHPTDMLLSGAQRPQGFRRGKGEQFRHAQKLLIEN